MKATANDFAIVAKTDYQTANSVLRFLESKGFATVVAHRPNIGGKGRAASVFEISDDILKALNIVVPA